MISDHVNYIFQKDTWFSPKLIIVLFEKLYKKYGENIHKPPFKRALEMFNAAVALLGAYELDESNKFWLQSNTQSNSPDVMAVQEIETPGEKVTLLISQLEMVEFEQNYPNDDIVNFLQNTKLSPRKAYDEHTLIVVMVNRKIQLNPNIIIEQLKKIKPKSTIYIVGKLSNKPDRWFMIFSPYPKPTKIVPFNILNTAKKYSILENVRLYKGANEKIKFTKAGREIITLSEVFSFNEDLVKKYILNLKN